jgi:hypothetical protein
MPKKLASLILDDGEVVFIEAEEIELPDDNFQERGNGTLPTERLEQILDTASQIAQSVFQKVQRRVESLDEIEASFGIKVSTKLGVIIASGDAEANFVIKLKWKRNEQQSSSVR